MNYGRQLNPKSWEANPFVVMADLLTATFFIVVLFIYAVKAHELASVNPRIVQIESFKRALGGEIRSGWTNHLRDEGMSRPNERQWWTQMPEGTDVVFKQDASSIKLVFVGGAGDKLLFDPDTGEATGHCRQLIHQFAHELANSEAARRLAREKAISAILIEGHTIAGDMSEKDQWQTSVNEALAVRELLQSYGELRASSGKHDPANLFWPGRFTIVGKSHYYGLPFFNSSDPRNRRVQIEIRFTERFESMGVN